MSFLTITICIVGLVMIVLGAEWIVDGSAKIARRFGVSEFVIGLTIVGFGTSAPELVVSLTGAIENLSDVAIGNVIGSNIFNTLLILGITALMVPVVITEANRKRDIPVMLGITVLFVVFGLLHHDIDRLEGLIFLLLFAGYIYWSFKNDDHLLEEGSSKEEEEEVKLLPAIGLTTLGLVGLIGGGKLFVDSAVDIAHAAGVSEKVIALTLLAGGTSLPELLTSVVAAIKKKSQLALGNIIGSNVFNILLILGAAAVVRPINFVAINVIDICILLVSALLLLLAGLSKKGRMGRGHGVIFVLVFAVYMTYLFVK